MLSIRGIVSYINGSSPFFLNSSVIFLLVLRLFILYEFILFKKLAAKVFYKTDGILRYLFIVFICNNFYFFIYFNNLIIYLF